MVTVRVSPTSTPDSVICDVPDSSNASTSALNDPAMAVSLKADSAISSNDALSVLSVTTAGRSAILIAVQAEVSSVPSVPNAAGLAAPLVHARYPVPMIMSALVSVATSEMKSLKSLLVNAP